MKLTDEQLQQVEEFSELQFGPVEIAAILDLDEEKFQAAIENEEKPVFTRYRRGRLRAEAEVRKSLLQLAKQGSSPAQKQILELIEREKYG